MVLSKPHLPVTRAGIINTLNMNTRAAAIGGLTLLLLAVGGNAAWTQEKLSSPVETLPLPPVPPRIADGEDYEHCLALLGNDPTGANAFADAWEATGGGEGALHCHALAQVALGNVDAGADMLDRLAANSHAPTAARAAVYGQADQAWLMAGQADRAFASATLALSLSSRDAALLIDRSIAAATLGRYNDSVEDLSQALEWDGRRTDALVLRAAAWRHLDHLDLAQDDIDRAFALDTENPEAFLERGILRQRYGDWEGARLDWVKAVALAPNSATSDLAEQNIALLESGPARR